MARCGRVTASEVADALAFLKRGDKKGGDTEARKKYKARVVAEILTGEPDMDGYVTSFMSRGTDNEPYARAAYEVAQDVSVDTVGFILHPTIERAGASPDGIVGDRGGLEIKCPSSANHIKYLDEQILPEEYEPQVMFNLACSGQEWWDFVSYDDRLKRHPLFIKRVYRDESRIAEIEQGVMTFLADVDNLIARLDSLYPLDHVPRPAQVFTEQLRQSIAEDPELGITDDDLPEWAREMQVKPDEVRCPTCGSTGRLCWDLSRFVTYPDGIWHRERIEVAQAPLRLHQLHEDAKGRK